MVSRISAARGPLLYVAKDPLGIFSLCFATALALMAAAPGLLSPYDPYAIDSANTFSPPSLSHPFGTDDLGRDVLSQVIHGARVSMTIALSAVAFATVLGSLLGLLAGYYGGRADLAVSFAIDARLSMPTFFLVLVFIAIFGSSMANIVLIIGITLWTSTARIVRAAVHSLRSSDFVEAAKSLGAGSLWIMGKHILPQVAGLIISVSVLELGSAIIIEAGLSFLGLGDPTVISWGRMLSAAQTYVDRAWWMGFFPGIFLFLSIFSFNILGDRLYEYYNPKAREKIIYI